MSAAGGEGRAAGPGMDSKGRGEAAVGRPPWGAAPQLRPLPVPPFPPTPTPLAALGQQGSCGGDFLGPPALRRGRLVEWGSLREEGWGPALPLGGWQRASSALRAAAFVCWAGRGAGGGEGSQV